MNEKEKDSKLVINEFTKTFSKEEQEAIIISFRQMGKTWRNVVRMMELNTTNTK